MTGVVTVRSAFTVSADGNSITEEAVVELTAIDGTNVDTFPFATTHARVAVEPPPPLGTPEAATPSS